MQRAVPAGSAATIPDFGVASNIESTQAVMFADVSDSTRLYETLGDREALRLVGACLVAMRTAAENWGGRVVKTIGDELMCAFADAPGAAMAATEMQIAVSEQHEPLSIRIGFDCGPVIEQRDDLFGDTVNVAARIAELAQPGQILASARALELLPDHMGTTSRPLSGITVKGKTQELEIGEIVWHYSGDLTTVGELPEEEAADTVSQPPTLRLRHASGEKLMVGTAEIKFGRGADNDFVIADRKASRSHASIELRRDKFVLIDRSSNGTYVILDGTTAVIKLKREEFTLSGRGRIGFGHSPAAPGADTVEFTFG
jgi:class 3 adenylate cyclase